MVLDCNVLLPRGLLQRFQMFSVVKRVVNSFGNHYQALRGWTNVVAGIAGDESQPVLRAGLDDRYIVRLDDRFTFDDVMIRMPGTTDKNIIPASEIPNVAEECIAMCGDHRISCGSGSWRVIKMPWTIQQRAMRSTLDYHHIQINLWDRNAGDRIRKRWRCRRVLLVFPLPLQLTLGCVHGAVAVSYMDREQSSNTKKQERNWPTAFRPSASHTGGPFGRFWGKGVH